MEYTISRHKVDKAMLEVFYTHGTRKLLAFVMHEDCLDDAEIVEALDAADSVEVELRLCLSEGDKP